MTATLYERLGGADRIRSIVNTAIDAHYLNPAIRVRFEHVADPGTARERAFEFFAAGSGGPQTYTGKAMPEAHAGMNVSEQEYLAVIDDIMGSLRTHEIGQREQEEVLAILYSLKDQIIRV